MWPERDFDFPIRIMNLAAPEKKERGGIAAKIWLESRVLGKEVEVVLSKARVEKWGRLLADIMIMGLLISEESVREGHGVAWADRKGHGIPNLEEELKRFEI